MYLKLKLFENMNISKLLLHRNHMKFTCGTSLIKKMWYCTNENIDLNGKVKIEKLKKRSVLSVEGMDSLDFLQDLTTNDIKMLDENQKCIYTAFLNAKGKVIHDSIIYKPVNKNKFLVECDISSVEALQVHMTMYRNRRRVDVKSLENEMHIWAIYSPNEDITTEIDLGENVIICFDPRVKYLGLRVLAPAGLDVVKKMSALGLCNSNKSFYKSLRYKLGIGEGILEIPYGSYTPREVNCDLLNGTCSKKTSFIGYEAAIKQDTKHNSRFMPIILNALTISPLPLDTPIEDAERKRKTPIGYLRGNHGVVGIGLMKVNEALHESNLRIGKVLGHCIKPPWWPQETIAYNISNK